MGTLTSGGLKVSLKDGQLRIDKEGRHRKFVKKVRSSEGSCCVVVRSITDGHEAVCRCSRRPSPLQQVVTALCCMSRNALCSGFALEKALSSWRWLLAST